MAKKTLTKSGSFPIIGQTRIRRLLAQSLRADRVAHAYLFVGQSGIGKTAVALEFARLLLCSENGDQPCERCDDCRISRNLQHPDLRLIFPLPAIKKKKKESDEDRSDFSSKRSEQSDEDSSEAEKLAQAVTDLTKKLATDPYTPILVKKPTSGSDDSERKKKDHEHEIRVSQIRSILHSAALKPFQAARKVFVIFHADAMNVAAQNAFLKVLEEPPEAAYFLLTTEREQTLRPTVRSRCQRMPLPPLPTAEIAEAVAQSGVDSSAAGLAAELSGGSVSRARELAGGDVRALQSRVIDFLKAAATCDPFKLPGASEALLNSEFFPQHVAFDLLKLLFRDLAVRRLAQADGSRLPVGESEKTVDGILSAFPHADPDAAAHAVDECAAHLARGYTEAFALHAFAIRLHECLGPRVSTRRSSTRVTHASHS